jgi:L-fucose dehydrogenase
MDTGLKDKVVIVTGGASGIGRATVLKFSEEGAMPVFIDKNRLAGESLGKIFIRTPEDYMFIPGDLTDEEVCKSAINRTMETYGRLDILVNNAGKNDRHGIENTSPEVLRKSLENNLIHYYTMAHYAWPHLKESKGNIVCVGSKVAFVGSGEKGGTVAYAIAKGGINAMVMELASYSCLEHLGIRVNGVAPGIVKTQLFDEYMIQTYGSIEKGIKQFCKDIPLDGKPTPPEAIANVIVFLASNHLSPHTTGQILIPDGGYCKIDRSIKGLD